MEKSAKTAFQKYGIKGVFRYYLQRAVGMPNYEEQIKTIHYYLNNYFDITRFPQTDKELLQLHEGDAVLLAIVDEVCRKYGVSFWLDGGTILGAVRHHGFVPWDDDMDICMMRDDYEKIKDDLVSELGKYGILAEEYRTSLGRSLGIGYKHRETGLWLDIIPCEWTTICPDDRSAFEKYKKNRIRYLKYIDKIKKSGIDNRSREQIMSDMKRFVPEICDKEEGKSIIYSDIR